MRLYRAGPPQPALSEVCQWPAGRLRDEVQALAALREQARRVDDAGARVLWQQVPVTAALMLHTDCARSTRDPAALHESVALEIARTLSDDEPRRDFARRWYGVMVGLAAADNRWQDARGWAERGLRALPGSADLLAALGATEEELALQALRGDAPPAQEQLADPAVRRMRSEHLQRREVQDGLEKARQALVAATAADPALCEAQLRLGRVAWRLGNPAEGRAALEHVLSGPCSRSETFLARLFVGRLDEDAGRLEEAARSYEAALALEVNSQSARLALSHVRLLHGDEATARAEAERAVRAGGSRLRADPFWLYPWGPAVGIEGRLEALRREARS